jgi:hypothetical protein
LIVPSSQNGAGGNSISGPEDLSVEEEEGAEGVVFRGGHDARFDGQEAQEPHEFHVAIGFSLQLEA